MHNHHSKRARYPQTNFCLDRRGYVASSGKYNGKLPSAILNADNKAEGSALHSGTSIPESLPTGLGTLSTSMTFLQQEHDMDLLAVATAFFRIFPLSRSHASGPVRRTDPIQANESSLSALTRRSVTNTVCVKPVYLSFVAERLQKAFGVDLRARHCCCGKSASISWRYRGLIRTQGQPNHSARSNVQRRAVRLVASRMHGVADGTAFLTPRSPT